MPAKVCILTTIHRPFDTRIFHKQAKTLVKAGYDVTLIAQHERDEVVDGVKIIALPKPRNRFTRVFGLTWRVFRLALRQHPDIYHFHDPELIPVGLLLRFTTDGEVIYDVHEDYVTSIQQKQYLPKVLRRTLSCPYGWLESRCASFFTMILAEKYYRDRFPKGVSVLNYPDTVRLWPGSTSSCSQEGSGSALLYTGAISEDRGALIHAGLPKVSQNIEVHMIGQCAPQLAARMWEIAGNAADRLYVKGIGVHVPYAQIVAKYKRGGWVAGLALFPPTKHYLRKEPTKIFEYMAFGIPVLCSSFPVWKELVEGNECGLTVDPLNPEEIAYAIEYLLAHHEETHQMGENGRRAVLEKYNWESEGKKLLALYEDVLSK